jgi:hypothetical protein
VREGDEAVGGRLLVEAEVPLRELRRGGRIVDVEGEIADAETSTAATVPA